MTRAHPLLLLLLGCTERYVHVFVEGSDLELTVAPTDVRVGVYGDERRLDFAYTTRLRPQEAGGVPASDFVVTLDELTGTAQLRVAVPTSTTTWFADAIVDGAATDTELHLPLFAGERAVSTANYIGGDLDTSVLFGPGIAMAWVDAGGVQARIERDPDQLIARAAVVAPDAGATNVRLSSRLNPLGYGPDLYAIAWIGSDRMARLRVTTLNSESPVRTLGGADDVAIGAALKGEPFAAAVATRSGDTLRVATIDEAGSPIGALGTPAQVATTVTTIVGAVVTRDGIILGWRANDGSHIAQLADDGSIRKDTKTTGDLLAVSLSVDGSRVLTLERRGTDGFVVSYFSDLTATGVETPLGTTLLGARAALSGCAAAWPELRADASKATDLRFAVLDPDGRLVGEPHLLNVEDSGDHLAPTLACASQTRVYATFFGRAALADTIARLRIRRVPTVNP